MELESQLISQSLFKFVCEIYRPQGCIKFFPRNQRPRGGERKGKEKGNKKTGRKGEKRRKRAVENEMNSGRKSKGKG